MGGIGWSELIIVLSLVLLLFGSKRIPDLARALGKAKREFKKAQQDILENETESDKTDSDKENYSAKTNESEKTSLNKG